MRVGADGGDKVDTTLDRVHLEYLSASGKSSRAFLARYTTLDPTIPVVSAYLVTGLSVSSKVASSVQVVPPLSERWIINCVAVRGVFVNSSLPLPALVRVALIFEGAAGVLYVGSVPPMSYTFGEAPRLFLGRILYE